MQIYADVLRLPISTIGSASRARRSGSAIHAAVAAGAYPDVRAAAAAMGRVRPGRVRARRGRRRGATTSCSPSTARCTTTSAAAATRSCSGCAPFAARPLVEVTGVIEHRSSARRRQRPARRSPRCTPSWSATASSSGRPATSRPACPGADLFVIKPSGVSYDELTPDVDDRLRPRRQRRPGRRQRALAVERHRGARLRLPAHAGRRRRRAHPLDVRHRLGGARRGDPVRAHRRWPTSSAATIPVGPFARHRRRLDRPRHRRDAARPPLAARC